MKFVELNRGFLPVAKGDAAEDDIGRFWNHKYSGAIFWPELRKHFRVVLLAEAANGKTEEFRNQISVLRAEDHPAFFVRIEELADADFEAALDPTDQSDFEKWQRGGLHGWFFLDSLDEARLNRKSFEKALKNLSRALGSGLNRSHIFISCRVSDWKGNKDREEIERLLPARRPADASEGDDALLDPIFNKDSKNKSSSIKTEKPVLVGLRIFRITSLISSQYQKLAVARGVTEPAAFTQALVQRGLEMFTERPGDVLELADYWKAHKKFASFEKMTEHAVSLKLREPDAHRADNDTISNAVARSGAELLAAALTFGKATTLTIPSHEEDAALSHGAVDPELVLSSWKTAERNALMRRAAFAPATYGRIRFHHKGTQEYLAAKWLDGLLASGCPMSAIWQLIFVERYGVRTLAPSLHPVAAWLSLWHPSILDEVVKREPLVLIRHGDPGSLSVNTRGKLLAVFAAKQAAGEIYNDSVDHRALWMFSDKRLDTAIRTAWKANARNDFRLDLLRLIREGDLFACADLALETVLDSSSGEYLQYVSAQILKAECNAVHLKKLADMFKKSAAQLDSGPAAAMALAIFPKFLSVAELLKIVGVTEIAKRDPTDGISHHLADFYEQCLTDAQREELITGLAELCLRPPFAASYKRISKKHFQLAKGLQSLAKAALSRPQAKPTDGLLKLLMAAERADKHFDIDEQTSLADAVRATSSLNRALFWADVVTERRNRSETPASRVWQIYFQGGQLWALKQDDQPWLMKDLRERRSLLDKQIALSAIVSILGPDAAKSEPALRALIKSNKTLNGDLDGYLSPPRTREPEPAWKKKWAERERLEAAQTVENKKSWQRFKTAIIKIPGELRDPVKLATWNGGSDRLFSLTKWLQHKVDNEGANAAKEWRLLSAPFSDAVAKAYRDGMKALWRLTKPQAATRKADGTFSFQHTSQLSSAAIGIEASEDTEWVSKLSDAEVLRAFQHGANDYFGYPDWVEDLISGRPDLLLGDLEQLLKAEWNETKDHNTPLLYKFASGRMQIGPEMQNVLLDLIHGSEPVRLNTLDYGIRTLKRLDLGPATRMELFKVAKDRLATSGDDARKLYAARYIAWMMVVDVNIAFDVLADCVSSRESTQPGYGEWLFGVLFERHDPIVYGVLDGASVDTLEQSLELAYRYVRPQDDVHHEGVFEPGARDAAEEGRNTILSALIARPGADSYRALQRCSNSPAFKLREHRFREIAKGKAESDAEFPAWEEEEVLTFAKKHTAPVKTGVDLLNVVSGVLDDIQHSLSSEDVTSRTLLLKASDEEEVKNWLVEQMKLRAQGRFLAYREAEIAFGDMPDVIASSTAASAAVAFEVKNGRKNWSTNDHIAALTSQLAEDYLKPAERRQGVFVISNHGTRTWKHPLTGATIQFGDLISLLKEIADGIQTNTHGAIEVRVFGLDAALTKPVKPHRQRKTVSPRRRPKVARRSRGASSRKAKSPPTAMRQLPKAKRK
ncbi:MAG: hypothetical protein ABJA60_00290 [Nitrosospira sp.]